MSYRKKCKYLFFLLLCLLPFGVFLIKVGADVVGLISLNIGFFGLIFFPLVSKILFKQDGANLQAESGDTNASLLKNRLVDIARMIMSLLLGFIATTIFTLAALPDSLFDTKNRLNGVGILISLVFFIAASYSIYYKLNKKK